MNHYHNDPLVEKLCMSALECQRYLEKASQLIHWYDHYKQSGVPIPDDLSDELCDFSVRMKMLGYKC